MLFEVVLLAFLLLLIVFAGIYAWRFYRQTAQTASVAIRLFPVVAEAEEFFELVELSGEHAHFLDRHGPWLNREEILGRSITGEIEFSGFQGNPVSSARWLSHRDLLRAINSALEHWKHGRRPKNGSYNFIFEHNIGEGYLKGGSELKKSNIARIIVRRGKVVTAFPVLEPNQNINMDPLT